MNVIIADDHALVRRGLAELAQGAIADAAIREAATAEELRLALETGPETDLILLDLYLPGASDLSHLRRLRAEHRDVAVLVVSAEERPDVIRAALAAGINGFVPKSASPSVTAKALELVLAGGVYVPPQALAEAASAPASADDLPELTPRKRLILRALSEGASNREIADRLGLAEQTVKNHITELLKALGVENRQQAAELMGPRTR